MREAYGSGRPRSKVLGEYARSNPPGARRCSKLRPAGLLHWPAHRRPLGLDGPGAHEQWGAPRGRPRSHRRVEGQGRRSRLGVQAAGEGLGRSGRHRSRRTRGGPWARAQLGAEQVVRASDGRSPGPQRGSTLWPVWLPELASATPRSRPGSPTSCALWPACLPPRAPSGSHPRPPWEGLDGTLGLDPQVAPEGAPDLAPLGV